MVPRLAGKGDLQPQLDNALQDVNDMYLLLEETEKQAVRKALIEERGRFCTFITFLQPVVVSAGGWHGGGGRFGGWGSLLPHGVLMLPPHLVWPQNGELTMLGEITHLQGIIEDLVVLTAEPHKLPPASEQVSAEDGDGNGGGREGWGAPLGGLNPILSVGDQGPEGLRLQLVLPDPPVLAQQLQLPQVQHVQVWWGGLAARKSSPSSLTPGWGGGRVMMLTALGHAHEVHVSLHVSVRPTGPQ